ncbi:pyridoxamine 5'-phosphate oxidase family protein [uncultured Dysosmobacter sp.]|uniref:pyridoxamine 5'-phosphate oxidase family protein n=1 Tax=uncultured Dysosmobacter sp. TaxID=2591384 RepID=UPI003435D63D
MAWFVYMLCCGDGSLYTGYTDNVARRLAVHQSGKGAKYTRSRLPVSLAYQEGLPDRSAAMRREAAIKRLTRQQKLSLIAEKELGTMKVQMRRKDREMPAEFAWSVVDRCEYAFLAMTAEDGSPYGLPVTIVRDGNAVYFHSAMEGRKVECLRRHPRVCLTCVGDTQIQKDRFTTLFESAVAFGTASEVTGDTEKTKVLRLLCQRHTPENMAAFDKAIAASLHRTAIWKITVEEITGKAKR